MAKKKSKRPNLPQETLERARAELRGEAVGTTETIAPVASSNGAAVAAAPAPRKVNRRASANLATRRIPAIGELVQEYSYVTRDLRNLLILAVVLLVVIVIAAVAIPRP